MRVRTNFTLVLGVFVTRSRAVIRRVWYFLKYGRRKKNSFGKSTGMTNDLGHREAHTIPVDFDLFAKLRGITDDRYNDESDPFFRDASMLYKHLYCKFAIKRPVLWLPRYEDCMYYIYKINTSTKINTWKVVKGER